MDLAATDQREEGLWFAAGRADAQPRTLAGRDIDDRTTFRANPSDLLVLAGHGEWLPKNEAMQTGYRVCCPTVERHDCRRKVKKFRVAASELLGFGVDRPIRKVTREAAQWPTTSCSKRLTLRGCFAWTRRR
jgi:hypothetical protein